MKIVKGDNNMKKYITCLMLSMVLFVSGTHSIYAIETNNTDEPKESSGIIFETDEEYNSPERVQERKEKMERFNEFMNTKQARIDKYTISLPLRGQQKENYCAPASAEMEIDYQLGTSNNIYTQDVIASRMGTTENGTTGEGVKKGLNSIIGLGYTYQSLSEISLYNALKTDINQYIAVLLPFDASEVYSGFYGMHMVAAKGYSSSTVIYLDPWRYDKSILGEHEVSLTVMQRAIKAAENKIVW